MKTIYHFDDCPKTKKSCICLDDQKELKQLHNEITKTYEGYIKDAKKEIKGWKKELQKHKSEVIKN